ncbi:MAG: TatD family hydrolase [Firmicutes bacterium]|nr:TatD family hydrolase [Bacillota bacterium]
MLIDSHAHLDMPDFDRDRDEVVERAAAAGVAIIVNVGFNRASSQRAMDLAGRYPGVYFAAGVHPHDAKEFVPADLARYRSMLSDPKAVAVGEIGLDFYRDLSPRPVQREVFRVFLRLAIDLGKPIIVHDRDAHDEVVAILKEEGAARVGGVMHCFSGDWPMARECLKMGFLVSFAGPVTYPNARRLGEVARLAPKDTIMVETDCPYLTPQAFRGKRNEPSFVVKVAEELGRLRGIPFNRIAELTSSNTRRVFGIPPS